MTISRTVTDRGSGDDETLPSAEPLADEPGGSIGRFVIEGALGRGGMGLVLAAQDPELGRRVAIKLLLASRGEDFDARLDLEARAMARLAHPNVVTVYEVGSHHGRRFIAMELVEGETLRSWTEARARSWREIVAMFIAAGRGLEAAHRAGLVHRDFKPDNVLVGRDGRPRVGDFGLVSTPTSDESAMMGTPAYMAPEQLAGIATDERSDQFAFAVALHEALHGARPFPGRTHVELRMAIADGKRTPTRAGVPAWLTAVIERALAIDPDARWPAMGAMLDALGRDPAIRRRRIVLGAVIVALAGVAIWALLRPAPAGDPCAHVGDKVRAAWSSARRQAIVDGFAATGMPYASALATDVLGYLDGAADNIVAARVDACRATHTRGEQSDVALDARMRCLDRHLAALTAVADLLAHPDQAALDGAPAAASRLGDVSDCANTDELSALPPRPTDPPTADALTSLDDRLEVLSSTSTMLGDKAALSESDAALAEARRLGYCPDIARALELHGSAVSSNAVDAAGLADGQSILRDAAHEADGCGADRVRAESLITLANVLENPDPASPERREVIAEAEAVLRRLDNRSGLENLYEIEADEVSAEGKLDLGVALGEAALAMAIFDHHGEAHAEFNVALAHLRRGDVDRAEELAKAAFETMREHLGPDHPQVAQADQLLGMVRQARGDDDGAIAALEDAARIQSAAFGPEHRQVLITQANLGASYSSSRRYQEGRALLEKILPLVEKVFGPEHELVNHVLNSLANCARGLKDYPNAIDLERRAIALDVKIKGADHPSTAVDRGNLSAIEGAAGDWQASVADARAAVAVLAKVESAQSPALAHALYDLGDAECHTGAVSRGLADLDRARAIFVSLGDTDSVAELDDTRADDAKLSSSP